MRCHNVKFINADVIAAGCTALHTVVTEIWHPATTLQWQNVNSTLLLIQANNAFT